MPRWISAVCFRDAAAAYALRRRRWRNPSSSPERLIRDAETRWRHPRVTASLDGVHRPHVKDEEPDVTATAAAAATEANDVEVAVM